MCKAMRFEWDKRSIQKWERKRADGKTTYIVKQLILFWLPYFVGVNLLFSFFLYRSPWDNQSDFLFSLIVLSLTAVAIGCVIEKWKWAQTEASYIENKKVLDNKLK